MSLIIYTKINSAAYEICMTQVQLLQELVGTSRKMGAHPASTRHMTYLLQHMFNVLSMEERQVRLNSASLFRSEPETV